MPVQQACIRQLAALQGLGGLMDSKKERERPRAGQAGNGEAAAGSSPPRPADGSHMRSLTMPAAPAGLAQLLTDDEEASTGASSAKASSTFRWVSLFVLAAVFGTRTRRG